ncbi:MAG: flagellar hook-length control protein FliK [Gammaproteobacteria bacterium]|nr:flagellar hook-length control protein FliK [Gammaproteobacteria bacterium]
MKIPATLQPLLTASRNEIPSLLKQLQIGQILPAKVLAQLQPNLVRLQLATTELLARSPVRLETGASLRLEVVAKTPVPELRILREPVPVDPQKQVVRSALARQLPAADVREQVGALRQAARTPQQVELLQRFESILRSAGLGPERPTAHQVQRAIALSGIFHETQLRTGTSPTGNVKRQLLQLLSTLSGESRQRTRPEPAAADRQPTSPEGARSTDSLLNRLLRLVEGSINRIQMQQSTALPVEDSNRQAWQVDIPMRLPESADDILLRIERDSDKDSGDGTGWAVNLAFEFDTIGTLQCRIGLQGDRVATTFWCEQSSTLERVEQRLPTLHEALEAQGLEVVHLRGTLGEPPDPLLHVPLPDILLDEHA